MLFIYNVARVLSLSCGPSHGPVGGGAYKEKEKKKRKVDKEKNKRKRKE